MSGHCSCSSSSDSLSCLRSTSASTLSNVNNQIEGNGFYGTVSFVPVVDGTLIVERPTETLGKGKHNGVSRTKYNFEFAAETLPRVQEALYSVTNVNEGPQFVQQSLTIGASQYISGLFPNIQASQANSLAALYADFGTNIAQADSVMGEGKSDPLVVFVTHRSVICS